VNIKDYGLLGCDTMWACKYVPIFWTNMLPW